MLDKLVKQKNMTQLLAIDDDFHAALKMMSAIPSEKRGMKAIVQDELLDNRNFSKHLADARSMMRKAIHGKSTYSSAEYKAAKKEFCKKYALDESKWKRELEVCNK